MEAFFAGVITAVALLSIVPPASVTMDEVDWARSVCAVNGGVKSFHPSGYMFHPTKVTCTNTAIFIYDATKK